MSPVSTNIYGYNGNYGTPPGTGYIAPYPGVQNQTNPDSAKDPGKAGSPTGIDGTKAGNGVERECQTCKNRKYQDGSDEMVSFKSATHISPEAAAVRVRAHEQEHVSNAFKKAAMEDAKVVSASVTIHTDICPECGRSYVSGGTTSTQIKYTNEENPYQQMKKTADAYNFKGMNIDVAV